MNTVAFDRHSEDAELETMAEKLGTTAPRLRPMLNKLESHGWLTIEGRTAEYVYPTVEAIRWTNRNISVAEAEKMLRGLRR
jgi:DNA-binding IclR family transcriptional regulator